MKTKKTKNDGAGISNVLVILSNRLDPKWRTRYYQIHSKPDGTVLREVELKRRPASEFDEVWENDDGRTSIDSCTRMRRHYKHPLIKRAG
jgi:hypothetical protein